MGNSGSILNDLAEAVPTHVVNLTHSEAYVSYTRENEKDDSCHHNSSRIVAGIVGSIAQELNISWFLLTRSSFTLSQP